MAGDHSLDNPARASLLGPQAHLAERCGAVLRYAADISPFVGLPDEPGRRDWSDLAKLTGADGVAATAGVPAAPPPGWQVLMNVDAVQLTGEMVAAAPDAEAIPLGRADVPEMLDLVARTRPGPFLPRTIELGGYLGIRRDGALVAMAGERLRPPGWAEISAVCTDPAFRGQGLATRLTLAVAAAITARGEQPFLHAASDNVTALQLYESLGFSLRRPATFVVMRAPGSS
ncbi:MAG TPA: GNAT family N-acetyltransferase [Streptosporangiaceae bacterium]|nr:GNAT family N-acetyltransferase [Streptosporangiaceae bacterium]